MKDVAYYAPQELQEALTLLAEHPGKITLVAGGTDLVPRMKGRLIQPEIIVYVGRIGLDYIVEKDEALLIGAATPWCKIADSPVVAEKAAALAQAARQASIPAVKSTGTIGGNLGSASPAADLATPLLVLDAQVRLQSARGNRTLPLKEFFLGPGETAMSPDELILEVVLPASRGSSVFLKVGRRKAMTLSVVNVAVRMEMAGARCVDVRIALGSMAPTPIRCYKAEAVLKGKEMDGRLLAASASEAVAESDPIDDGRATAWYRRRVGEILLLRALKAASGIQT